MIGLLDAATRYQDNQGAQFETFASQRIRGAMLDELRAHDWVLARPAPVGAQVEEAIRAASTRSSVARRPKPRSPRRWA